MSDFNERIQVLHVDDEPGFADMAGEFLEREDARISVHTATNAREGLERLADGDIDCIVSDYNMPGQNGIEFLETVQEAHPDLPFILFTGKGSEAVASDAISAGVTDYLQKESGTEQYEILAHDIVSAVQKYRSEAELDDLRRRYTTLVEQNFVGIYIIQDGELVYVNPRLAAIHGYDDPKEVIGLPALDLIAPAERDKVYSNLKRRLSGEVAEMQYQTTGLRKDGERIDIELHGSQVEYEGDTAVIGAELFISERKDRERDLTAEKEKYTTLVEQSHDGIIVLQQGEVKFVNERAVEVLQYGEAELLGTPILDLVAPEDRDRLQDRYERRLDPEEDSPRADYDMQFLTNNGEQRRANISAAKIQFEGEPADLVSFRDITERKRYERELERAQTRFQTVFEKAPESIAIHDGEGNFLEVNDQFQAELGYSEAELVSMTVADIDSDRSPDEVHDMLAEMRVGETREIDGVNERNDGSTFPVEVWVNKIEMDDDVRFLSFGRNISERKDRENELLKLKRRFKTLIEAAPDPVFVADTQTGEAIETNTAAESILGLSREEIIGKTLLEVAPEGDGELYLELFEKAQEENTTISRLSDGTRPQLVTADGGTVPVEISAGVAVVPGGEVVVGIFRDISDRVGKEAELEERNEQLEAFASVVSHDLRNPLNVASGSLELARKECDNEQLAAIKDAHRRMDVLIEDLLVLAQEGEPVGETEAVVLADFCHDCWTGVDTSGITSHFAIDRTIRADASRLKQIFENLFRNSSKHGGGDVTVTVGELEGGFFVEDDGLGIPDVHRGEVFNVGYSTREEGTGFGLGIVKEIVEAHGWDIRVTAGTEGGARFEITGVEFIPE